MKDEPAKKFPNGCFLPLNAIAVHPQGHPHFCLTSTLAPNPTLRELNQERKKIHQQLLDGSWPETCMRCFNKEKHGLQSRRTRTWQRKTKMYGDDLAQKYVHEQLNPTIRHLEISFSNVCNLSCSMCSSEFSTSWIKPDEAAEVAGLEFRKFTQPFRRIARVSKELLQEILENIHDFDLIIVKGGEPTREPICLDFLEAVGSHKNRKKNLSVFVQSNGTKDPDEWIQRLKHLNLEIGYSMDGWNEHFEWIRGGKFSTVLENFKKINSVEFVRRTSIDFTLSAYNIFHLRDLFNNLLELKASTPKLELCPVFQWVQQPYASPLTIKESSRLQSLAEIEPILTKSSEFFLNSENLVKILKHPRMGSEKIMQAQKWYNYMNNLRKFKLPDHEKIQQALSF